MKKAHVDDNNGSWCASHKCVIHITRHTTPRTNNNTPEHRCARSPVTTTRTAATLLCRRRSRAHRIDSRSFVYALWDNAPLAGLWVGLSGSTVLWAPLLTACRINNHHHHHCNNTYMFCVMAKYFISMYIAVTANAQRRPSRNKEIVGTALAKRPCQTDDMPRADNGWTIDRWIIYIYVCMCLCVCVEGV